MTAQEIKKKPRKKTSDVLYHYTSQEGLLGIIGNGNIRATDIFYLNDATEYTYAHELMLKVTDCHLISNSKCGDDILKDDKVLDIKTIISLLPRPGLEKEFQFAQNIAILVRNLDSITAKTYVSSFSEMGDQLSQWRGYCDGGYGYSIGFDREGLRERISKHKDSHLAKCVYEKSRQIKIMEKILPPYLAMDTLHDFDPNIPKGVVAASCEMMECAFQFLSLIPQFKHKKFIEEQEWRFVYRTPFPTIKLRPGKSMLLPYVQVPLFSPDDKETRLKSKLIKEVIVGPTPHHELSMKAVRTLLEQSNIDNCIIRKSDVPYRSW